MSAYYNEIDPYAAQWLRNLISAGHIAPGHVDERSITDVRPDDLRSYAQCHFFAGIGGWSYALRLAGWPDDRPVWTGSCPCQPLSVAGQQRGHADERHIWPAFHRLISECRPATVFGEQVASKDGREWLSAVRADLEGDGYAVGCADLCAAGVGAPHIRQRLWWLAHSMQPASERRAGSVLGAQAAFGGARQSDGHIADGLANGGEALCRACDGSGVVACPASEQVGLPRQSRPLGDATSEGLASRGSSAWSDPVWLPCTDGKARPTKPGIFPLAHGVPARVGKLRAAGNAIVPQVAAEFIVACWGE